MTFLGLERPVEYGRELVFDPTTAQMVLNANRDYINAVYNDYRLALADMKEFNKEYGDFLSPIQADMDWYEKNVTGRVRNFINDLYARGIDPLRSAEGRALVTRELANMPTGEIALLRQSAETAKEYLKSFGDDTNPELEKFLDRDLSTWSTLGDKEAGIKANGVWRYNKASKYQTIDDLIEPIVRNIDYTYDDVMTKQRNDGNDYYTITKDRLMLAVNDNMSDILATPSGAFHWEQAKKAAVAQGGDETLARSIFNTMIGNRIGDHERIKKEVNPFKLDDYRTANDIRAHNANAATDYRYDLIGPFDLNGNGKLDTDEERDLMRQYKLSTASSGGKKTDQEHNIFREADRNYWNDEPTDYNNDNARRLKINPVDGRIKYRLNQKSKVWGYDIPADAINGILYAHDSVYDDSDEPIRLANFTSNGEPIKGGTYNFIPNGNIKAKYDRVQGRMRYFISGTLRHTDVDKGERSFKDENGTPRTYEMEVKERDFSYENKK